MDNPNEELTPVFEGEEVVWIPVVEYYARIGHIAVEVDDDIQE